MADDKALDSTAVPPTGEAYSSLKDTIVGEHPAEGVSGPTPTETKPQAAESELPAPKTDVSEDNDALKIAEGGDSKDKSPVGGAEDKPITESSEKPTPEETAEGTPEESAETKESTAEVEAATASGETKPLEEPKLEQPKKAEEVEEAAKKAETESPEANGPTAAAAETKDEPAKAETPEEDVQAGEKRTAEAAAVANGAGEDGPPEKKVKVSEGAPTTNGGAKRGPSKAKKDKKEVAPVGRTARRTRSQGLTG